MDEVKLAQRQDRVEPVANELAQPLLVARDRRRGELPRDQPAVAAVLGRVELEEVPARREHVLGQVLDRRSAADLRRIRLRVAEDREHIVVLGERPEAAAVGLGVAVDGRLTLEQVEHLPRFVVGEQVVVEQIDRLHRGGGYHRYA